jgi:hypothetical protein
LRYKGNPSAAIRIDRTGPSSIVVNNSCTTGMAPGVTLATLDVARYYLHAGGPKPCPFSVAANLLRLPDHTFSARAVSGVRTRHENVGITYAGGCGV